MIKYTIDVKDMLWAPRRILNKFLFTIEVDDAMIGIVNYEAECLMD